MACRPRRIFRRSTRLKDFVETTASSNVTNSRAFKILKLSDAASAHESVVTGKETCSATTTVIKEYPHHSSPKHSETPSFSLYLSQLIDDVICKPVNSLDEPIENDMQLPGVTSVVATAETPLIRAEIQEAQLMLGYSKLSPVTTSSEVNSVQLPPCNDEIPVHVSVTDAEPEGPVSSHDLPALQILPENELSEVGASSDVEIQPVCTTIEVQAMPSNNEELAPVVSVTDAEPEEPVSSHDLPALQILPENELSEVGASSDVEIQPVCTTVEIQAMPSNNEEPAPVANNNEQIVVQPPPDTVQQSQLTEDCSEILQTEGLRAVKIIGVRVVTNNADAGVITTHLVRDNDGNDEVDVYVPVELIDDTSETKTVDNVLHYLAENSILVDQENSENVTQSNEQNVPISQNKASGRTRKRKRNTEQHKKVTRKRLRNSGQEYVTQRGTVCAAKRLGPSCSCRRHCFNVLTDNQCDKICSDLWKMGDFDCQNAYLYGQIKCYSPVRRRANIAHDSEYLKQHTFAYYVKSSTSHDVRVCKKAFLSIHGLHQNAGRLENILTQITTGSGVPEQDSRGKHHNRPNRTAGDVVKFVKDHISSFPVYQSHYSRRDNINRVYLGEDLNIAKMHRLYTELGIEKNWPKVTPDLYRRIVCEEFNIGFKLPQTDTCKVCDELQIQINAVSDSQKPELESRLAEHKKKAESAFTLLHQFSKHSSENPNEIHVVCFDLQQALPTPKLSTGPAFYKRKLWTYNLCVHDSGSNKATMFVWPETIAGRGANEIASCLLHYFNNTTIEAKKLVVFSDNCSGQNKNFTILSLWQYLVAIGKFEEILHIFPVSGHTMMPCDRDFGDIERVMRKRKCIYSPTEYIQLIAEARTKNPFKVVEMTSSDFVTVSAISKLLTKRTETVDKDKVDYRLVSQFRILSERPQWLEVRFSHDETESWKAVNLQKRGRPTRLKDIMLQPILNGAKSVPKPKVDDVRSLLPYIPPIHHSFYNSIVTDKVSKANDVEILDDYESE